MAFDSFRDFLNALDAAGELVRIQQPVATELEITELANRQMKSQNGGKALLMEKPIVNGVNSPFPVAINTMGSWKRMALALGAASVDEAAAELGALMKAKPPTSLRETLKLLGTAMELRHAKPKSVKSGPCKEVIHRFEESRSSSSKATEDRGVDGKAWPKAPDWRNPSTLDPRPSTLLDIPILKCWPLDGGRFITLPCVVTKDPDTGERNVGMYRIQIYDERTTGMHWQLQKVGARHGRRYYESGTRMPVAIFLGAIRCLRSQPPRRCRTGWMNFCWPVICEKNPSSW